MFREGLEADFVFQRQDSAFRLRVDLAFSKNFILCIEGAMGVGKSTFFHCTAGLLRPQKGFLRWEGKSYMDRARGLDLPPQERAIAYLFQEDRIFKHLSVQANLLYGWKGRVKKKQKYFSFPKTKNFFSLIPKILKKKSSLPLELECEEILELLNLRPLLEKKSSELSGGESRRLALGRCLLSSFRLLLLDEPFRSLSPESSYALIEYLKKRSDISIIFSSHQDELRKKLGQEKVEMEHGKLFWKPKALF